MENCKKITLFICMTSWKIKLKCVMRYSLSHTHFKSKYLPSFIVCVEKFSFSTPKKIFEWKKLKGKKKFHNIP